MSKAVEALRSEWRTFSNSLVAQPNWHLSDDSGSRSLEALLQGKETLVEDLLASVGYGDTPLDDELAPLLCTPAGLRALVLCLTGAIPDDFVAPDEYRRWRFIACEILQSGDTRLLEGLLHPWGAEALDLLLSFLEVVTLDESLSNCTYVCRSICSLLAFNHAEVASRFRQRTWRVVDQAFDVNYSNHVTFGTTSAVLLGKLLSLLELRCFAELLATLLCAKTLDELCLPIGGIASSLVDICCGSSQVFKPDSTEVAAENAALVIDALLTKTFTNALCYGNDFLQQLCRPELVTRLVDSLVLPSSKAFDASLEEVTQQSCRSNPVAAIMVLCSTLTHVYKLPRDPLLPCRAVESSLLPSAEEDEHEFEFSVLREASANTLVDTLSYRLPKLLVIVESHPEGHITLLTVSLLARLASTGREFFFAVALAEGALQRCLDVFFRFPWQSILHNAVLAFVIQLMGSEHGSRLARTLIHDAPDVLGRIVAAFQSPVRVGYMGHLRRFCEELEIIGNRDPCIANISARVDGWLLVVVEVNATRAMESDVLGDAAPVPCGDTQAPVVDPTRCAELLVEIHTCCKQMDALDVGLGVEDLRDLFEDLETEHLHKILNESSRSSTYFRNSSKWSKLEHV